MAEVVNYKAYKRNQRRATLETDFSHGMMASNSVVDEGYVKSLVNFTFEKESGSIVPRPALRPYQIITPDMDASISDDSWWFSDGLAIKDVKECVEDGVSYYQIIVGAFDKDGKGHLGIITSKKTDAVSKVAVSEDYEYDVRFSNSLYSLVDEDVLYYTSHTPQIHNTVLADDSSKRVEFPVGTFAFGNSYYFFTIETDDSGEDPVTITKLCKTFFDISDTPYKYNYQEVAAKTLSVSEAVTYGYNMLLKEAAYTFENKHTASSIQFEGILPYAVDATHSHTELLMTPKKNQPLDLVCYYDAPNEMYDIVWESREVTASDWTLLKRETVTFDSNTVLSLDNFHAQDKEIMIRVSAYPYETAGGVTEVSDVLAKAMVVGFDFTIENYGAANSLEQKVYDISTATGMESWKGRIVVWGLPADPTILFISDYNEPSYFPYPNNIVTFDEPVIYAIEFMDSLCVFTTNKLYQVTLAEDGTSWKSAVIQSHLSINEWDKHLIQTVRNMLYFKSGNYYYMMVPKAQSLTGELTLAPITTPITSFFDNFSVNVETVLSEAYGYTDPCELVSYYNFLDYDDIHNLYLYKFDNSEALLHFDVIYNTVDRTWKIWLYESAHILFPFKHNATEPGLLATISSILARDVSSEGDIFQKRIIQIFAWDKLSVRGEYLPTDTELLYDSDCTGVTISGETVVLPGAVATIDDDLVVFGEPYADADGSLVTLLSPEGYYSGFSVKDMLNTLQVVYNSGDEYFTFKNYQFLDTGYRKDDMHVMKRYRELQLLIDNLDKQNIDFGMEYLLDGTPNRLYYKYDVSQTIDEFDPEYGIVYIDSTPYLEVDLSKVDKTNQWTLDQELAPDIKLWKVRVSISGKGSVPRFKLYSRNEKRFGLLGIYWISRIMNMR